MFASEDGKFTAVDMRSFFAGLTGCSSDTVASTVPCKQDHISSCVLLTQKLGLMRNECGQ